MTPDRGASALNPFLDDEEQDLEDRRLVGQARDGSRDALEALVRRHQSFLYNLALRMLYHPQDAEDASQEILIKVVTKLGSFEGRSRFRTWLYRVATNHLLNVKRGRLEEPGMSFADFGRALDATPELDLPDPRQVPVDVRLLVDEARIGCTSGMLLCLDREQRMVYALGAIFGATDVVGAEVLGIGRDAFRQKLARARRDLHSFMHDQCGLVDRSNPCRCARKTRGFMQAGYVDPQNLLFARERVRQVREVSEKRSAQMGAWDDVYAEVYREHPFADGPDLAARIRALVDSPEFRRTFEV